MTCFCVTGSDGNKYVGVWNKGNYRKNFKINLFVDRQLQIN